MAEPGVEVSSQFWSRLFHHLSCFYTILGEWSSHLYTAFLGVPVKGPLEQVSFNVKNEHSFVGAFQTWSNSLFILVHTHAQTSENTHTHVRFAATSMSAFILMTFMSLPYWYLKFQQLKKNISYPKKRKLTLLTIWHNYSMISAIKTTRGQLTRFHMNSSTEVSLTEPLHNLWSANIYPRLLHILPVSWGIWVTALQDLIRNI